MKDSAPNSCHQRLLFGLFADLAQRSPECPTTLPFLPTKGCRIPQDEDEHQAYAFRSCIVRKQRAAAELKE